MSVERAEQLELVGDQLGYLLEEIQLSFWVDFTEQDIIDTATVGDLFDNIVRKMGEFESPRCLTSFAYFRLRRSLIAVSNLDRRSVRPATQLRTLLPQPVRRTWWEHIETTLRLRVPGLRPGRAATIAYSAIPLLGVFAFAAGMTKSISWELRLVMPLAVPVLLWWLFKAASHLPREFPVETFGDLVRRVVTLNQQKLARDAGGSTIDQAWAAFREILSAESGIASASITREMRFPEDLRLL
jgi:hypothetical protein